MLAWCIELTSCVCTYVTPGKVDGPDNGAYAHTAHELIGIRTQQRPEIVHSCYQSSILLLVTNIVLH